MTTYCTGFMFDRDSVLLIEKKRPKWQAGKLNGIGGHVEDGETPLQAMSREFAEETGLQVSEDKWLPFVTLHGPDFAVHFFATQGVTSGYQSLTDEAVYLVRVNAVAFHTHIPNLAWLIPAAKLVLSEPGSPHLSVWQE